MNKKRTFLAVIVATMMLLSACDTEAPTDHSGNNSATPSESFGNSGNNSITSSASNKEGEGAATDSITPEAIEEPTRPLVSADLSSEWSSFQFELEGKLYTLPFSYSELEANGWIAQDNQELDETLESGKYVINYTTLVYSNKENTEIYVQFANLDEKDMPLRECYVSGIQFAQYSWSENTVLYFPGGFTLGSTKQDVEKLYGEPSNTQESSTTIEWKYETKNYNDVIFTFTKETGKIEKMRMSNAYLP